MVCIHKINSVLPVDFVPKENIPTPKYNMFDRVTVTVKITEKDVNGNYFLFDNIVTSATVIGISVFSKVEPINIFDKDSMKKVFFKYTAKMDKNGFIFTFDEMDVYDEK